MPGIQMRLLLQTELTVVIAYSFLALLGKGPKPVPIWTTLCHYCTMIYILGCDLFNESLHLSVL